MMNANILNTGFPSRLSVKQELVSVGGVDFVTLNGGVAKIGNPDLPHHPVREVNLRPGLKFSRDPITNRQWDEYIEEMTKDTDSKWARTRVMGPNTHALVLINEKTQERSLVGRGNEYGYFDLDPALKKLGEESGDHFQHGRYRHLTEPFEGFTQGLYLFHQIEENLSLVAYGTQRGNFKFLHPNLNWGANVFYGKYVRVVPDPNRYRNQIKSLSSADHPGVRVSWYDGLGYFDWMSRKTGQKWRFPTAEEWEAVALAGRDPETKNGKFGTQSGSEESLSQEAHFNSNEGTVPVNQFPPNPWGVRGMAGNVTQWTESLSQKQNDKGIGSSLDEEVPRILCGSDWKTADLKKLYASCFAEEHPEVDYDNTLALRAVIDPL